MKRIQILVFSLAMVLLICQAAFSQDEQSAWTGNINFFLGSKSLDSYDWEPVEDQAEFGIEIDFGKTNWPVNIAIDLVGTAAEEDLLGANIEGTTSEFNLGVRKAFTVSEIMHPFIGGGLSSISGEYSIAGVNIFDVDDVGFWLAGGVYWTLGGGFNIGLELKHTDADASFTFLNNKYTVDLGGDHFGLILGYHW